MNIFPVPDGDTGTNMSMTIGAAAERACRGLSEDAAAAGQVAKKAASPMLRGARGNSGVILSLLFRGICKGLEGKEEISAQDLVAALDTGRGRGLQGCDEAHRGHHPHRGPGGCRAGPGGPGELAPTTRWPGVGRRLHGRRGRPGGDPRAAARAEAGRGGGRRRPGAAA